MDEVSGQMSDLCPYRKILLEMPYPFAYFQKMGYDEWLLIAFNQAFEKIFSCGVGDTVDHFPFEVKTGRSEVEIHGSWYSVYSFALDGGQMSLIMHDITARRRIDDAIVQIFKTATVMI